MKCIWALPDRRCAGQDAAQRQMRRRGALIALETPQFMTPGEFEPARRSGQGEIRHTPAPTRREALRD